MSDPSSSLPPAGSASNLNPNSSFSSLDSNMTYSDQQSFPFQTLMSPSESQLQSSPDWQSMNYQPGPGNSDLNCCPTHSTRFQYSLPEDLSKPSKCSDSLCPLEVEDCGSLPCRPSLTDFSFSVQEQKPSRSPDTTFSRNASTQKKSQAIKLSNSPKSNAVSDKASNETKPARAAKSSHSLVERKYRENLNSRISDLHRTLLATEGGGSDPDGTSPTGTSPTELSPKVKKGDVLSDAMKYVKQAEVQKRNMSDEIQFLRSRVRMLEKLVKCEDCSLLNQLVNLQMQAQPRY